MQATPLRWEATYLGGWVELLLVTLIAPLCHSTLPLVFLSLEEAEVHGSVADEICHPKNVMLNIVGTPYLFFARKGWSVYILEPTVP